MALGRGPASRELSLLLPLPFPPECRRSASRDSGRLPFPPECRRSEVWLGLMLSRGVNSTAGARSSRDGERLPFDLPFDLSWPECRPLPLRDASGDKDARTTSMKRGADGAPLQTANRSDAKGSHCAWTVTPVAQWRAGSVIEAWT